MLCKAEVVSLHRWFSLESFLVCDVKHLPDNVEKNPTFSS